MGECRVYTFVYTHARVFVLVCVWVLSYFFWHTFFDDYSQEFVLHNETGTDISLIMSYHQKFHHQNKKQLLVCSFSLASSSDVMSIFRRQQGFAGRSVYYFNGQISFFCWPSWKLSNTMVCVCSSCKWGTYLSYLFVAYSLSYLSTTLRIGPFVSRPDGAEGD